MKNKKSQLFIIGLVVIVLCVLIFGYTQITYNYRIKSKQLDHPMGEKETALVNTYQRAENALFYIDQSAKYSLYDSLLSMAEAGAIYSEAEEDEVPDSPCGVHVYNLWNNQEKNEECYPVFDDSLPYFLTSALDTRLMQNPSLGMSSYTYETVQENQNTQSKLKVYGIATQKISFPITKSESKAQIIEMSGAVSYPISPPDPQNPSRSIFLSSCYGWRTFNGKQDFHDGIDIAASVGTQVLAISEGTVFKICNEWQGECACSIYKNPACRAKCNGRCGNYGNYILIKHAGDLYSRYSHLLSVDVTEGQEVQKGQVIGKTGNTGSSGGPHIDFKIYASGDTGKDKAQNPFCFYSDDQLLAFAFTDNAKSCTDKYGSAVLSKNNPPLTEDCSGKIDSVALISLGAEGLGGKHPCAVSVLLEDGQEPTLDEDAVNKILEDAGSPAKGLGHIFYGESENKRIDDVFALAFFSQESSYGKSGVAARTKSISNRRVPEGCSFNEQACQNAPRTQCPVSCNNAQCDFVDCNPSTGCFCGYDTWEKGIISWFDLISGPGYKGAGRTTVETIIPKYAPSSDNNNVRKYIQSIRAYVSVFKEVPVCEQIDEVSGSYSVDPHFTVETDFDKNVYTKLTDWAKETVAECSSDDMEACLEEQITAFNDDAANTELVLKRDCEDHPLYYDFVEQYYDCLDNNQSDCVCALNFDQSDSADKDFGVIFEQNKIYLDSEYLDSYENPEETFYFSRAVAFFADKPEDEAKEKDQVKYYAAFSSGNPKFFVNSFLHSSAGFETMPNGFLLYKSSKENITIVKEDGGKPECEDNKDKFRLCLVTQEKVPNTEKELKPETVKIKFALQVKDTTPPEPITGLQGTLIGGDVVAMTWNPSTAADLMYYRVYYANQNFHLIPPENIQYFDIKASEADTTYHSIDLTGATCTQAGTYYYCALLVDDGLTIPHNADLEMGAFHLLSNENKLFYLWNPPTNTPFYIAVVAIDKFGNGIEVPARLTNNQNAITLPDMSYAI